jgi:lysophospholipase L1-like esterase
MPERLPLRRRLIFSSIAIALSLLVAGAGLLAADLYLHKKYEDVSAVNIWGYRGPTIGAKPPGEFRIVVVGGSAAFGYGLAWSEAFPYFLEQRLNEGPRHVARYRVVNLAFNAEAAASFAPTLEDYDYLDYDLAILYEGYNDLLERPKSAVFRRQSRVFKATGYMPLLPMVLREKYFDWRYGGDIGQGYRANETAQTVFRPDDEAAAAAAAASLEQRLGGLSSDASKTGQCDGLWRLYCNVVLDAVRAGRARGVLMLVAGQPFISDRHIEQQAALRGAIAARFGNDTGVAYADFGRALDLRDVSMAFDGMHLTVAGNRVLADAFVPAVLGLIEGSGWSER